MPALGVVDGIDDARRRFSRAASQEAQRLAADKRAVHGMHEEGAHIPGQSAHPATDR
jgi:hypothetical protein